MRRRKENWAQRFNEKINSALFDFLSYYFREFTLAWMISKCRWPMDDRWDRIFITFNDLADSTADTLITAHVLMTHGTCRCSFGPVHCSTRGMPRVTCMQNAESSRSSSHHCAKCPLRADEVKMPAESFFDHCFE